MFPALRGRMVRSHLGTKNWVSCHQIWGGLKEVLGQRELA